MSKRNILIVLTCGLVTAFVMQNLSRSQTPRSADAQDSALSTSTADHEALLRQQVTSRREETLDRLEKLRQRLDQIEKQMDKLNIDNLVNQLRQDYVDSQSSKKESKDDSKPQAFIIGNSPYYQVMHAMAKRRGWQDRMSFNVDYAKYLPMAKGHILMIESHGGVPIIPATELDKVFPNASQQLQKNEKIEVEGTQLMLIEFSRLIPGSDLTPANVDGFRR